MEEVHATLLAQLRASQNELWSKGEHVRVEDLAESHAGLASDTQTMAELAYNEFRLRESRGESPAYEEYYQRLPACREPLSRLFETHTALIETHSIVAGHGTPCTTEHGDTKDNESVKTGRAGPADETSPAVTSQRYEIIDELGRGGFGTVLRARDKRSGQLVALKTMKRLDGTSLELFKGEFRYLQGVSHYNLVQLYELESDGQDWLLSMEFVDGCDFLSYVRPTPERSLDLNRLRESLGQLAEGIAALHRHGCVHRDLKPENVRVSPEGRVVVLDFGLAAVLNPEGEYEADVMAGTVAYMAPEQTDSPPVISPASDWYAMGVMLFQALTGQLPFHAESILAVLQMKRANPPASPKELAPDTPHDLNDLCLALLRPAPAERPEEVEIFRRLGHTPEPAPSGAAWQRIPLLGRKHQLQFLEKACQDMQQGSALILGVSGPSGIGKTALIRHFLDSLNDRGAVVLAGRCYEHESVPYKALDPIVDELARYLRVREPAEVENLLPTDVAPLAQVFPVLNRVEAIAASASGRRLSPDPLEVRRQAFAGLRHLFAQLGQEQPLILYIDDLQWGDVDSVNLLADLLQPPAPPRFMLLTSHRSEDADSPTLRAFDLALERMGTVDIRELPVAPLTEAETREFVVALLGSEGAVHAKTLADESGGNPFFITELVHALQSNSGSDAAAEPAELSLDGLIRSRVDRLPESARRLLEVVAVSGRPLESVLAYQASEDVSQGRLMMARLEAGRFVRGTGSGQRIEVETYHDRIREAVVNGLTSDSLRCRHKQIGTVLEESGKGDLEELAVHFEGADQKQKAGSYYDRAADSATQKLAFDHAANLYRKSLDLQQLDSVGKRELRVKLADALANAGRGAEAAPIYGSAAEGADGWDKLELERKAAEQFLTSGHTVQGVESLRNLLGRFGLRLPGGQRRAFLSLLWQTILLRLRGSKFHERTKNSISPEALWKIDVVYTAGYRLFMVDAATGSSFINRSLRWALDSGDPPRIARALASGATMIGMEGGATSDLAASWMEKGTTLSERIDDPFLPVYLSYKKMLLPWSAGRWKEALEQIERADKIAIEQQVPFASFLTEYRHTALDCMMMAGRWHDYLESANLWLTDSRARGNLFATCVMLVHSYLRGLTSDEPDMANELIEEGQETWPQKGNVMVAYWGLYGRVETALYHQDAGAAQDLLRREQNELNANTHYKFIQVLNLTMVHLQGRVALAAAMTAQGSRRASLLKSASQQARRIEKANMPWSNPLAKLIRAGIANLDGRTEETLQLLVGAEEELVAANMEMYAAATRRQRGRLIGAAEGEGLVAGADTSIRNQNVRNPGRIAGMLVPGF